MKKKESKKLTLDQKVEIAKDIIEKLKDVSTEDAYDIWAVVRTEVGK